MAIKKYIIGFLVLVILSASVYILLPEQIRIDIQATKTTFKVWENNAWVLSGTEYTKIYDGASLMRANNRIVNYSVDLENNKTTIWRYAYFKDGIIAIDIYKFDGSTKDKEMHPVSHEIKIINGTGKILVYEVNDLFYAGETINNIKSPQFFGHSMKVEWEAKNYYSQIFKYKNKNVGKLTIKYKINSEDYGVHVKLFDPSTTLTLDFSYDLEDIMGIDEVSTWYAQSQIRWNISSIPAGNQIIDATLCLYWFAKTGSPDNDVNVSRVNNQTWTEAISAASYNALPLTNSSVRTWNSTTLNTYGCTNVTDIIATDYGLGNNYSSIRLLDQDFRAAPTVLYNAAIEGLLIGDTDVADLRGEDRENSGYSNKRPILYVTHTGVMAPTINFVAFDSFNNWYGINLFEIHSDFVWCDPKCNSTLKDRYYSDLDRIVSYGGSDEVWIITPNAEDMLANGTHKWGDGIWYIVNWTHDYNVARGSNVKVHFRAFGVAGIVNVSNSTVRNNIVKDEYWLLAGSPNPYHYDGYLINIEPWANGDPNASILMGQLQQNISAIGGKMFGSDSMRINDSANPPLWDWNVSYTTNLSKYCNYTVAMLYSVSEDYPTPSLYIEWYKTQIDFFNTVDTNVGGNHKLFFGVPQYPDEAPDHYDSIENILTATKALYDKTNATYLSKLEGVRLLGDEWYVAYNYIPFIRKASLNTSQAVKIMASITNTSAMIVNVSIVNASDVIIRNASMSFNSTNKMWEYNFSANSSTLGNFTVIISANVSSYSTHSNALLITGVAAPLVCNPTLNEDWVISDAQVCNGVQVTTGTGNINITGSGTLTLINSANVTTKKLNIQTTGNRVFVNSGCRFIAIK